MKKIIWDESYSVGVHVLDVQHRKIINCINKLIISPGLETNSELISDIFNELLNYCAQHLDFEEKLLQKHGYPHLETHQLEHMEYVENFAQLSMDAMAEDHQVPEKLLEFLKDWWVKHILIQDMKYKSFFAEKVIS